jgi:hypothetical protein
VENSTVLVYLCGPIAGLTYDEANDWRQRFVAEIATWSWPIKALSPLRYREELRLAGRLQGAVPLELKGVINTPRGAALRDELDVRRCQFLFANFIGATKISQFSLAEIGMARGLRKTIIAVMEPDNIHHHRVMDHWLDYIEADLESGLTLLKHLILP